jgi:hypothetical protein
MSLTVGQLITYLDVDDSAYNRKLDGAERALNQSGERQQRRLSGVAVAVGSAVGTLGAMGLTAAGAAVKNFVSGSVDSFASLEDATGAAGVVLGDAFGMVERKAKNAAQTVGLSTRQYVEASTTFGILGKSAGLAGDDLGRFSTDMSDLAGDMASFRGTSPEQAIEAIGAALRGESEPIRTYGVLLDDATLRNQALKMGLIDNIKQGLTPQQKALAAQAEILRQTSDAQGDFARTMDSTANVQKRQTAESENAQAVLGAKLAPAVTAVRSAYTELLTKLPAVIDTFGAVGDKVTATSDFLGEHETVTKVLAGTITALMLPTLVRLAVGYATTAAAAVASSVTQTAAWLRTQVQALATGVVLAAAYALTIAGWVGSAAAATASALKIAAAWLIALGPVGLVIAGVGAVVAIFVTAYKTSETFRNIVNGAMGAVQRAAGDAVGFLIQGFRGLLTVWLAVAGGIVSGAATALGWIPGLGGKLKGAERAFQTMKGNILGTLDQMASSAHGYGAAAGQGLANGLASKRSAVAHQAYLLAAASNKAMQGGFQVASPSKVTTYIGEMVGQGLIVGMDRKTGDVAASAGRMASAALPELGAVALPAVARVVGGDGGSIGSAGAGAPDLSSLLEEMRATRTASEQLVAEMRRQTDQQGRLARSEPDRMPA